MIEAIDPGMVHTELESTSLAKGSAAYLWKECSCGNLVNLSQSTSLRMQQRSSKIESGFGPRRETKVVFSEACYVWQNEGTVAVTGSVVSHVKQIPGHEHKLATGTRPEYSSQRNLKCVNIDDLLPPLLPCYTITLLQ